MNTVVAAQYAKQKTKSKLSYNFKLKVIIDWHLIIFTHIILSYQKTLRSFRQNQATFKPLSIKTSFSPSISARSLRNPI